MVLSGRLSKTIQFAIGLAAAGGFALVLNNGAWAAEMASPDVALQAPVLGQWHDVQDQMEQNAATAGRLQSRLGTSFSTQAGDASQTVNAHPAAIVAPNNTNGPSTPAAGAGQSADVPNSSPDITVSGNGSDTPPSHTASSLTSQPAVTSTSTEPPSMPAATPIAMNAPQLTVPVVVSEAGTTHRYRTVALVIQPTITSHNDLPAGLVMSSQMPRTAQDSKVPARPNGLLSAFASELAGSIVPQLADLPVLMASSVVAIPFLLLGLALCLFNLPGFSYGLWLRRSGYAHAARSDMAALSFATPLLLSYAKPSCLPHSSFFLWCQTTNDGYQYSNQEGR